MTRLRQRNCWIWSTGCLTSRALRNRRSAPERAVDPGHDRPLRRAALLLFRPNDEFVTDAMNRDDVARVTWSLFDLLTQLGDVHVDRSGEREAAVAPDRIEQLVARDYFASMFDEIFQDVEFSRRDFDRRPGLRHFELFEIDRDHAEMELFGRFALAMSAAQERLDPGHQFHEAERLGHIIIGADLQPDHFVDLLAAGGEHDDWRGVA